MSNRNTRICYRILLAVAAGIAFVWFLFAATDAARVAAEKESRRQARYVYKLQEEWMASKIQSLTTGQSSGVFFYSTSNSDVWVSKLAGMAEIKWLTFWMTDLTDGGVNIIAKLPNIEKLTIHGGTTSDVGLGSLGQNKSLRTLHLVNLDLTDSGLTALSADSELENLTVYSSKLPTIRLSDLAVHHLRKLKHLRKLNVGGGWLSSSAVEELKSSLPDCEIVENYADDEW